MHSVVADDQQQAVGWFGCSASLRLFVMSEVDVRLSGQSGESGKWQEHSADEQRRFKITQSS